MRAASPVAAYSVPSGATASAQMYVSSGSKTMEVSASGVTRTTRPSGEVAANTAPPAPATTAWMSSSSASKTTRPAPSESTR